MGAAIFLVMEGVLSITDFVYKLLKEEIESDE